MSFEKLQERVEAAGGTLELYTGDEGCKVLDLIIPMVVSEHYFPHTAAGHKILQGFLDSLKAKAKARQLYDYVEERLTCIKAGHNFDKSAAELDPESMDRGRIDAYGGIRLAIRREFDIEEDV